MGATRLILRLRLAVLANDYGFKVLRTSCASSCWACNPVSCITYSCTIISKVAVRRTSLTLCTGLGIPMFDTMYRSSTGLEPQGTRCRRWRTGPRGAACKFLDKSCVASNASKSNDRNGNCQFECHSYSEDILTLLVGSVKAHDVLRCVYCIPLPPPGISHGRPLARRDRPDGAAGPGGVARRRSMVSRLRPGE